MRYPVNTLNITQGHHQGKCLDLGWTTDGTQNQPIYACDDGVVYSIENQPNGGNVIYLVHDDGKCSCYAHLSKVLVKEGQRVDMGEQIGNMGATGKVSGPHLHFGLFTSANVRYKNSTLDPFDYLEIYEGQSITDKTKNKYGDKIKTHQEEVYEEKEVFNVDEEGLTVRDKPQGEPTGEYLKNGEKVKVLAKSDWTKIGNKKWVYSKYLK